MAYRLSHEDSSVEAGVRRIACEQIDRALAQIDGQEDRAEVVHDVRLRCKKLRGLLRLVRPAFDDFAMENAAFRDIARMLSGSRDAAVMRDTCALLAEHYASEVDPGAAASVCHRLAGLEPSGLEFADAARLLGQCREQLAEARGRAAEWRLGEQGWAALGGGLAKTYARAGKAAQEAHHDPSDVAFHELRKRLKYHWYHTRLLRELAPELMQARAGIGSRVSSLLGDHHDLCVFDERIVASPELFAEGHDGAVMLSLARRRKLELEEEAWPLIGQLLAESPKALARRWHALWRNWRGEEAA